MEHTRKAQASIDFSETAVNKREMEFNKVAIVVGLTQQ
jgi:hypothetical protein